MISERGVAGSIAWSLFASSLLRSRNARVLVSAGLMRKCLLLPFEGIHDSDAGAFTELDTPTQLKIQGFAPCFAVFYMRRATPGPLPVTGRLSAVCSTVGRRDASCA
ncbi:hypothetical protein D3C71_1452290 [compost metagenome]